VVNFSGSYFHQRICHTFCNTFWSCYNSNQQMQPIFIKIMCLLV